jgi:hypothetical protein
LYSHKRKLEWEANRNKNEREKKGNNGLKLVAFQNLQLKVRNLKVCSLKTKTLALNTRCRRPWKSSEVKIRLFDLGERGGLKS